MNDLDVKQFVELFIALKAVLSEGSNCYNATNYEVHLPIAYDNVFQTIFRLSKDKPEIKKLLHIIQAPTDRSPKVFDYVSFNNEVRLLVAEHQLKVQFMDLYKDLTLYLPAKVAMQIISNYDINDIDHMETIIRMFNRLENFTELELCCYDEKTNKVITKALHYRSKI